MEYEARRTAGIDALRANDAAGADAALSQCVAERPDDPEARLYLGVARGILGRLDEAAEQLEAARALLPDDTRVLFNLARLHHRAGDTDAAAADYREVLRRDPNHAKAREALTALGQAAAAAAAPKPPPRAPWEAPTDVEPLSAARAETPLVESITPSDYVQPLDDQAIRRIDVLSAFKLGAVMGAGFGVLCGLAFAVAAAVTGDRSLYVPALIYGVAAPVVYPISVVLQAALYNVFANWFGPVTITLDKVGPALQVSRIEAFSMARMVTAISAVGMFLYLLIWIPIAIFMLGTAGVAGGGAAAVGVGAGMLIGFAIGGVIGIGVVFVGALLVTATYNFAVGFTGGFQFRYRGEGGLAEIRSLFFWPTWLAMLAANAWVFVLLIGLGGLIFALGEQQAGIFVLVGEPLLMAVGVAASIGFYNLAAAWFGGLKLTLDEY